MRPIIKLANVWKTYLMGKVQVNALRGLDFYPQDFAIIMGPSGPGKSTAMNMIGCLDIPTKGKVFLDGQDISLLEESELATLRGKKIGFVFQSFNLLPTLDASENIAVPMVFHGKNSKERNCRAIKLLNMLGLSERAHHKPNELSGVLPAMMASKMRPVDALRHE